MRPQITLLAFFLMIASCYSTPEDITTCVGSDVNIPWEYPDSANMISVTWDYIDALNNRTTVLLQVAGSPAMIQGSYNIQHNTNGDVTITSATVANSGTYKITVGYSSATPSFIDNVDVNIYDPPTDFNFTESPSGAQTTFTCTATSFGDPAANLYIQVNGEDMINSVSATVSETEDTVKCFLSGPSVQCMSGVSGNITSLCAQCPTTEEIYDCPGLGNSTAVDSEVKCASCWFGIGFAILLVVLYLNGIVLGCILKDTTCCCVCFYEGESCRKCAKYKCCYCGCCAPTPCGACCIIGGLPPWYKRLWASAIGIPIAFGIWVVWICCGQGKSDKDDTSRNVESTRSSPEKAKSKLLNEKKQSSASGKTDGGNKGQHVSDTQPHPNDKSQKVHQEKEGRRLPSPPPGAILNLSQLPNIHDKKGRGLSANFTDEHHPLANIDIPAKKAGALDSIPDSAREEVKKKKKRSKKSTKAEDDDQND